MLLVVLFAGFVTSVAWAASMLPANVATHFNAMGVPDGWMSRSIHLATISAFGVLFPGFLIGVCWSVRFMPTSLVNIPHREYWLSSEHRGESARFLFRHSLWLGCLSLGFVTGLNVLIVISNLSQPVHLPFVWGILTVGLFIGGVAVWVILLYRRFRLPDSCALSSP